MKLSTKIILPIIIISALLILLNGCISTVPDDSPGYTPGTITGIIASPCCSLSSDPANGDTTSPEYWCYWCQNNWDLQDGIEVILTYGEDEVATTTTNELGEYTFTNVDPGKNYVVTAYCPDFADNRPLVKDVALELIEGGSFDTKVTDLVSTSFGLVVDFLVNYTEMGPEDISLIEVIADKPSFPNFPKFKKLVYEVRRVLENCELNMLADDELQDALCLASEEVGRVTFPDLVIGCVAGYTPPPPEPGACDGNLPPIIDSVESNSLPVIEGSTVNLVLGESYDIVVTAHDQDTKLGTLTYYATVEGVESPVNTTGQVTVKPDIPGVYEVYLYVNDGCIDTPWGPVTINVCPPLNEALAVVVDDAGPCSGDPATITSVTANWGGSDHEFNPSYAGITGLSWVVRAADVGKIDFDETTGEVTLTAGTIGTDYHVDFTYEDECGEKAIGTATVNFVLCNVFDYLCVQGWNSESGCVGGPPDLIHKEYSVIPYDIYTGLWLTSIDHTPNVKNISFTAFSSNVSTLFEYKYRYQIQWLANSAPEPWADWSGWFSCTDLGWRVDEDAYGFKSACMDAPSKTSTPKYYCHQFEIEIAVDGDYINTYIVHVD